MAECTGSPYTVQIPILCVYSQSMDPASSLILLLLLSITVLACLLSTTNAKSLYKADSNYTFSQSSPGVLSNNERKININMCTLIFSHTSNIFFEDYGFQTQIFLLLYKEIM